MWLVDDDSNNNDDDILASRGYRPPHTRPRLFLPYYEECKVKIIIATIAITVTIVIIAIIVVIVTIIIIIIIKIINFHQTLLSERSGGVTGDTSSFNFHRMSEIPDTLYMVSIITIIFFIFNIIIIIIKFNAYILQCWTVLDHR